jgi:copper oxidase (laccase) domain-containing protein
MREPIDLCIPSGRLVARVRCSTAADGDFHIEGPRDALLQRRQELTPGAWTQLDEVHGVVVRHVTVPGEHDFAEGDAAVTRCVDAVLSVWTGDCAPVVLVGDDGCIAVVHAGWRGTMGGVLQAAVSAMGSRSVRGLLGACIHGCCYEFGADLLAGCTSRFGAAVTSTTTWGTPSLDMPAMVSAALAEVQVPVCDVGECTRCHPGRWFSHRRGQLERQVVTAELVHA